MSAIDDLLATLTEQLAKLRPRQLKRVALLVESLAGGTLYWTNPKSFFADDAFAQEFGDLLRMHHNASAIPMTKDKFEYAMVDALRDVGHTAHKLPNGNPGEDIVVDGEPWSLKTQADRNIKRDTIHISKFMELGKGAWATPADLVSLRERMFQHMKAYDRIFTLRCMPLQQIDGILVRDYELVEIPKDLLLKSAGLPIEFKGNSRQTPKPASCYVPNANSIDFELYFDGGTERKLQIRRLRKSQCIVHATWRCPISA